MQNRKLTFSYKVIERMNPQDSTQQRKFYGLPVSNGKVGMREISSMISENCSLKNADVFAVLESLVEVVSGQLSEGRTVYLGDFGTFSPSIKTEGVESAEKFSAKNIKQVKVNFRQGPEFKRRLALIKFAKVG